MGNDKMKKEKLLNYFEDGFDMEKSQNYSTEQLIKFSEDIYEKWDKTHVVESLNDVCEIEREIVLRECDEER
jgi:hypothetical protein